MLRNLRNLLISDIDAEHSEKVIHKLTKERPLLNLSYPESNDDDDDDDDDGDSNGEDRGFHRFLRRVRSHSQSENDNGADSASTSSSSSSSSSNSDSDSSHILDDGGGSPDEASGSRPPTPFPT
ncbi:unnamed protein product [Hymenolepis diminuta]|uniref:Uncharacterized protein n=1 Tax=Hymenolepis diminuta TaxID=6216 RepID=A0A564Y0U4_HYMDI|nr:unnamed protein product [Hymenolepis diminuta]